MASVFFFYTLYPILRGIDVDMWSDLDYESSWKQHITFSEHGGTFYPRPPEFKQIPLSWGCSGRGSGKEKVGRPSVAPPF